MEHITLEELSSRLGVAPPIPEELQPWIEAVKRKVNRPDSVRLAKALAGIPRRDGFWKITADLRTELIGVASLSGPNEPNSSIGNLVNAGVLTHSRHGRGRRYAPVLDEGAVPQVEVEPKEHRPILRARYNAQTGRIETEYVESALALDPRFGVVRSAA